MLIKLHEIIYLGHFLVPVVWFAGLSRS